MYGTVVILESGSLAPGFGKEISGYPGRNLPYLQTSLSFAPLVLLPQQHREARAGLVPVSQ